MKTLHDIHEVWKMCGSKEPHTRAAAKLKVKQFARLGSVRSFYHCPHCDHYHLTCVSKEARRARKRP